MHKFLLPVFYASTVLYAAETDPMADACKRLYQSMEQLVETLESIQAASDASAAVPGVREALGVQRELLSVDAAELWRYIDNTANAKQPLVDMLERLAVQFARLEATDYWGCAELRELLSPQMVEDASLKPAKTRKIRAVDHDDED
ncbi:MAG: hypothetical protein IKA23_07930 [Akkermansia sp.]|nr:hypothetical protein [Akkermansia sp.]